MRCAEFAVKALLQGLTSVGASCSLLAQCFAVCGSWMTCWRLCWPGAPVLFKLLLYFSVVSDGIWFGHGKPWRPEGVPVDTALIIYLVASIEV